MGAVPKRKSSRARTQKRRSRDKLSLPQLKVSTDGDVSLHHRVSLTSGKYNGKKVIKIK